MEEVRIDKYLWAIRAFKSRSEATEACNGGKVKIGTVSVKPSKQVAPGETITVRKGPVTYTYKVLQLLDKRVGAQIVPQFAENLTPDEELYKLRAPIETYTITRDRGTGRPTKKDRRTLDALFDELSNE